ncbi:MAG: sulfotransferase [Candidatus Nomurabacteria bacterium]|nr:MAG: sulfotransferase [Candidatus Nomurabacteria bacterium]
MEPTTYPNSPVFLIGSPRSGKTILHTLLAQGNDFAWFSQYSSKFYTHTWPAYLPRIYQIPWLGRYLQKHARLRILPHPEEISHKFIPIMTQYGSLEQTHVNEANQKKLQHWVRKQMQAQKKNRMLIDCGRPARISFYHKVFPEAKFIHLIRDGRAVAVEMLRSYPYMFTEKSSIDSYFIQTPEEFKNYLPKKSDDPSRPLILAALYWKMSVREIERQANPLGEDVLSIRFEDILQNPTSELEKICRFVESANSAKIIKSAKVQRFQYKDASQLMDKQGYEKLTHILHDELKNYGYI